MFSFFKKKTVIPHVRLTGVIGSAGRFNKGIDLAGQRDILKKAFSIKKISHVAVSINSPGGSPVQSHLIYSYIRQLAKKNKVKVIIFAEDVAASGGYLISCAGYEIYANSSSIIGSIGVISASFGFKDLIKKMNDEEAIEYLSTLRQIGRWSAEMILLFTFNRSNIWPVQDIGLLRAISNNYNKKYLPPMSFVKKLSKIYSPYCSVATWYLWRSIDDEPIQY